MNPVIQNTDRIYQDIGVELNLGNLPNTTHRIRQHIQLQIPPKYTQEPIISNLAKRYEIEVNIQSALLSTNAQESGWFDLELYGTPARIEQGLDYLTQLHIEIWGGDRFLGNDWSFS
jgi:ABC-type methionine transport system ATPase subunit